MTNTIFGTAANDLLTGTATGDLILGYGGNDRLVGLAGDDTLDGGAGTNQIDAGDGNDTIILDGTAVNGTLRVPATGIDGGAGVDTIQFAGVSTDFHIVQIAGGWLQIDDLVNGGRTIAVNVEHLQFTDTDIWLVQPNTAPVVSGDVMLSVTEGSGVTTLDALANATDPDMATVLTVTGLSALPDGVTFDAVSNSFSVDASAGVFDALAAGEQMAVRIDYAVTDGTATTAAAAVVTVTGINDAAVFSGTASGSVTEDLALTTVGQLLVSDVDHGEAGFVAGTVAGSYGSLTLDAAGAWTYHLNNNALSVQGLGAGQVVQDVLTVHSLDGTATQISVGVTGTADASLIVGTDTSNRLIGTKAGEHIYGLGGNDRINGAAGDDTLSGGAGADVFVFTGRFGDDVITDFEIGVTREAIDLSQVSGLHGYADLRASHMTEVAGDTILTFAAHSITLLGVAMADLTVNDFLF